MTNRLVALLLALALFAAGCGSTTRTAPPSITPEGTQPSEEASQSAEPTAEPEAVTVKFEKVSESVRRGAQASVTARTAKGADCEIKVTYESGSLDSPGLDPKTAAAKGGVLWRWAVPRRVKPGPATVTVTCSNEQGEGKATTKITIK